jgi:PAS domain S-box-containing protein
MGAASQNRTPDTQLFRDVFNASPIGIAVENLEGQPLFVNPAFCSMLGFSEEELRGKHCVKFSPPEDAEKDWALFQQLRAGAIDHYQLEKRYFRRDGSLVWGRLSISLLNSRPSPLVVAMVEEITDKKTTEEAVRASEERLRLAQQIAHVGSFEWNIRTGVNTWTPELEAMYGLQPGAFTGTQTAFENLVHPDDRAGVMNLVNRALKTGQPTEGEWRVVWADGSVHWIAGRWQVFLDASGEPSKMIGVNLDVTERKLADEARLEINRTLVAQAALLQAREELLRVFVKNVPAAVAMLDRDMRYLQVSDRWCTDYLPGRTQILGRSHYEIFPDMPERWKDVHRRGLQGETLRADEDRWDGQDGPHWARWEVRPWKNPDGTVGGILILAEDITRRKQMQEALREGEEKLRLLLDSTAEAIYGIDLEHRCTFCNPACLRTLGYEHVDEVLGKNMHDLIHHTRMDGTLVPAEECRIHHFLTGEGVHAEDELFWRANGTGFPVEYWSYPQWKGQEVVGAVVAFTDITERKLAEAALANVSRKLIEAQEQERTRIGRELHDDIGQRLAMLAVELQQLQENSLILPDVRSRMGELQQHTSAIAADIQSLSHELHSAKLQYLGIGAAMRSFCREFGEQQKVEIDFQTYDLPSPVPPDTALCFFRVLQEALHNSAKHSGVRHFEVRLWGTSDEVHLTVRDSGAGFDREAAKMSQGLGLVSMEERLKLVNGTLSIDSQLKRGTTIHARVPIVSGSDSMRAAG